MSRSIKESVKTLLNGIVDYAGLFPPTGLSMSEAVINYAKYKNSNYNWMLGRFIVPVGRLDEFIDNTNELFSQNKNNAWKLSVLASVSISETIKKIEEFNKKNAPYVVCDTLELKANSREEIVTLAESIPDNFTNFFELPLNENLSELVSTLALNKQRAKIRTGGITHELIPEPKEVIRFVRTCLAANVPFKATAGLHHPVRALRPLTYEKDAPEGIMHGFLNLFLTTGFAQAALNSDILEEVLKDGLEESFVFAEDSATWQKKYVLKIQQLGNLRKSGVVSFGSCSFNEPIEDLQSIGLL